MRNSKTYITAGVAIATAAVTAHFMQSGTADPQAGASMAALASTATPARNTVFVPGTPPLAAKSVSPSQTAATEPALPEELAAPALPSVGSELQDRMSTTADAPGTPAAGSEPRRNAFGITCGAILTGAPAQAGMAELTLTAPCRGGERIEVSHQGMTFSGRVNHLGTFTALVPALAAEARFTIHFENGETAETEVTVPEAATIERVALMHEPNGGLTLHALEFGADYGQSGHVWAEAPRDADTALRQGGGFLTALGDETLEGAHMVQVYTFPGETRVNDGVVRLSVETEVSARNCDTEVTGTTLQRDETGAMRPIELTLSMPDCMAIGEFLVLKNLLRDLKIASN